MASFCVVCSEPQEWRWVDVSTFDRAEPAVIRGLWDTCLRCGSAKRPIEVSWAPSMALIPYGPSVPTPDDLLMGAAPWPA